MFDTDKSQINILMVDDDLSIIASIELLLKQRGFNMVSATCPQEAMAQLSESTKLAKPSIDLIIQDMNFSRDTSGEEGLELLDNIKTNYCDIPILLLTAWGSIELAVNGIKRGASDFITKPWNNQSLLRTIETCLELNRKTINSPSSRADLDQQYNFTSIIGDSPLMNEILATVGRVASTDAAVLILGESGTGKELIADAIHNNSARADQALVKVNLGGMTTNLFESEMFGHVKGAFTDAKRDRQGRFELANNGTIFLDEIGDLDPVSQVKLLRILQDQSYQPVGCSKTCYSNFRVVSATNRSLEEMVIASQFREDLFYRLNLITLNLPPLRERTSDIPLLTKQHLEKVQKIYSIEKLAIDSGALRWLEQQVWPGNIRQLAQTIERVVLMSGSLLLTAQDFVSNHSIDTNKGANLHSDESFNGAGMTLNQVEKLMIVKSLDAYQGNLTKVAEALGISRAALYRRLEKYELNS